VVAAAYENCSSMTYCTWCTVHGHYANKFLLINVCSPSTIYRYKHSSVRCTGVPGVYKSWCTSVCSQFSEFTSLPLRRSSRTSRTSGTNNSWNSSKLLSFHIGTLSYHLLLTKECAPTLYMTFNTIDKPINCNNPHLLAVVQVLPSHHQVIAAARFSLLLIILIDRCL
jgi:hypothetical protein